MHNDSRNDEGVDREAPTMARTVFSGAGFNKFNGSAFNGADVFHAMEGAFDRAMREFSDAVHESSYIFGGHPVEIRIVGNDLANHIVQAFAHLRTDANQSYTPKLTIDLWDENATNVCCYSGDRATCQGWTDVTSISPDGRYIGQLQPNTLTCFDRKLGRILGSIAWSDNIFVYERAKPLSRLLLEWYNDLNIQIIHAGLVSRHEQGVLFAASSGSGKSTAALACLSSGFQYVGEDFIGLQRLKDGTFVGHSLYNSVFLETDHIARFPELLPHVITGAPHEEKAVVILSHIYPKRLERVASINAVVISRIADDSESRFRPVSKSQALLALAPSSLIEIPSRGKDGFSRLAQLVEQVPTYALELGHDIRSIPKRVKEIIDEVNRA